MESNMKLSPSDAYPESMDFLSRTWCNFAVQTLQPELQDHQSIFLLDNQIKKLGCKVKTSFSKVEKSVKMEEADFKPLPPWKSNDVKSWIWMQQAMHPELNYNSCFRRKWLPWKIIPFKVLSIKKWLKDIKQKRKEEERLQRAEVHAAISVAGVAAALAAIAAESSEKEDLVVSSNKEAAVASAAALVAAQCAQVAEAMGAKREQLSSVIGSAMSSTSASDVLTLTAAAATCNNSFLDSNYFQLPEFPHALRGAATLKARTECKNRLNGSAPVLPIDEGNEDLDFNLEECRSILANGAELHVETPDGNFRVRSVSIILNSQAKVILRMRKLNLLKSKKESIILDMHAELYKDSDSEADTCYLIVLTTNQGVIKLDMGDDYHFYKTWAATISHMLTLSSSLNKYDLPFYKK